MRREWPLLAGVWVAAFSLRCGYIYQSDASPFFDFPLVDAKTYTDTAARMAAAGFGAGADSPFWQAPLYPYFLGIIFKLFGPGYYVPRLVQAALGSISCVLIYLLGRQVFASQGLALAASALAAVYAPFIFFDAEFLPPALAITLDLLLLLSLLRAISGPPWWALVAGMLLGLSALSVANILLFLPVAGLWLYAQSTGAVPRARMRRGAALGMGAAIAIAPVTLGNYAASGEFILISSNAGVNFYIGNNAAYEETINTGPGKGWLDLVSMPRTEEGITSPGKRSRFFFDRSFDFMRERPGDYIRLLLRKTGQFWHGNEIGRNQDLYYARNYSSLLSVLLWKYGIAFPFGLLAPLVLVGIGVTWVRSAWRAPGPSLLLLFAATYAVSVVLFFVTSRYRLPVVPVLLFFAVYGFRELYRLARDCRWPLFSAGCGVFLIGIVAVNFRVGSMDSEGDAETHHRLGFLFQQQGLPMNAVAAYRKALVLDPAIQEGRFNLGSLYAQLGQYDKAIGEFEHFIRRYPEHVQARYALGNAFLKTGRYRQAAEQFKKLLSRDRAIDKADLQGRLAYAYVFAEQPTEAIQVYRALLEANPDSVLVRYQLGQLYESQGMIPHAAGQYEEILRRDSTHEEARFQLARILTDDQPALAKSHLKRIIEQNPAAIAARWLLASRYMAEHRGMEALEQAEAILRVDPNHVRANWLAGHLHYMVAGDTLSATARLEQFKKQSIHERAEEIQEAFRKKLSRQYRQDGVTQ